MNCQTLRTPCVLLLALACLVSAGCCGSRRACRPAAASGATGAPKFLFVQSATDGVIEDGRLTLRGVSATTILFSDRPHRITGHIATRAFVDGWTTGPDSFSDNPPNATLSVLHADRIDQVIVELTEPVYDAGARTLTYGVQVLAGEAPAAGGAVSLFIDDSVAIGRHPIAHGHIENRYPGGSQRQIFHGDFNHSDD